MSTITRHAPAPEPGVDPSNREAEPSIAVLVPCYNEEQTVGEVVRGFRRELPRARVIVGDNNSSDRTAEVAREAGAEVVFVGRQGKGAVMRALFRDVEADLYVMVDGDATYPPGQVHDLLAPVSSGRADMSVGNRMAGGGYDRENKRPFHSSGNRIVVFLINLLFRCRLTDILSGYRAFSRRFVKNCPILEDGFTLETTMTLHALDKLFTIVEVPIDYRDRPVGSESKLSTYRDGFLVLRAILWIFKDNKPLWFFLTLSTFLLAVSLVFVFASSTALTWLGAFVAMSGLILLVCGFVLDTMVKLQRESFEVNLMQQEGRRRDHGEP